MGTQQFCLKWNNYHSNLSTEFKHLLSNSSYVDVTLACDGQSIKAHKVLLSACSPFFHELFINNPCQHPIVILKDITFLDMKSILDYIYHGEVNVSHDKLSSFLKTAQILKVKGLDSMGDDNEEAEEPANNENSSQMGDEGLKSSNKSPKKRKRRHSNSSGTNVDKKVKPQERVVSEESNSTRYEDTNLDSGNSNSYIMPQEALPPPPSNSTHLIPKQPDEHIHSSNDSYSHNPDDTFSDSYMGNNEGALVVPDVLDDDDDCIVEEPEMKPDISQSLNPATDLPMIIDPLLQTPSTSYMIASESQDPSTSHSTSRKWYACHMCAKHYNRLDNLNRHIKDKHELIKKHVCIECGQSFGRSDRFKIHLQNKCLKI